MSSMHLVITTPAGFEYDGIKEIKEILNGEVNVRTTYFRGLVLGRTELRKRDVLEKLKKADTTYISRVIPAGELVPTDIQGFIRYFELNVDIRGKRFAVRCKRRGNHQFSSMDVEREIGTVFREKGGTVALSSPQILLHIDVIQDDSVLSILTPDEIIKKTPKVVRKWEKGQRPISRAELKMREILERFPEMFHKDFVVIDIGAAPGGWSRAMSSRVKKVYSVDNARLDCDVTKIKNIEHIKCRGQDLKLDIKADIITNDANLLHIQSAKLSADVAKRYLRQGGALIHTVKLGTVPQTGVLAAKSLSHAVDEVRAEFKKLFNIKSVLRLRYNTKMEKTIIAVKRD